MAGDKKQPEQQQPTEIPKSDDDARVPEDKIGQEKGAPPNDRSQTPGKIYPL